MKKSLFLASLAVLTFNVLGMNIPNDQGENSGNNRRRSFQQINEENETNARRIAAVQGRQAMDNLIREAERNFQQGQINERNEDGAVGRTPPANNQNGQGINVIPDIMNMRRNNNLSAWFQAVESNNLDEMKRLSQELDIRSRDPNGNTALHIASANGNLDIIRWILGYSPELSGIVRFLSAHKNRIALRDKDIEAWCNQAFPDRLGLVNLENNIGVVPIAEAVGRGHLDIVKYLTERGADVNKTDYNGITPLHIAAQNGNMDIVRYLSEHGAKVNRARNNGTTPLYIAAQNGHLNVVQYLTEHGAKVNRARNDRATPLHIAAKNGHLNVVKYLTEHCTDVDKLDNNGYTPLHSAASGGHLNVVKYLTEHGADVNKARNNGATPLQTAALCGDLNIMQYLVEHGADVNRTANDGINPLIFAVICGDLNIMQYLVEHGADVNGTANDGINPLIFAVMTEEENIVRYLASLDGVDFDIKGVDGRTALDLARQTNQNNIIQILERAIATRSMTE